MNALYRNNPEKRPMAPTMLSRHLMSLLHSSLLLLTFFSLSFLSPADLKDGTAQRLWWNRYRAPWDKSIEEPYSAPSGITLPDTGASGDVLILTRSGEKYEALNVDL